MNNIYIYIYIYVTEDANGRNVMVWNVIQNKNGIMINANKSERKTIIYCVCKEDYAWNPTTYLSVWQGLSASLVFS